MKEIESEIYEVKQRILLKQMQAFEKNLDRILQIQDLETKEDKQNAFRENNQKFQEEITTQSKGGE